MSVTQEDIAREALDAIAKAQTTGITTSTGVVSFDLTGVVRQIPINTPFRDLVSRKAATDGAKFAIWRAFMNVNSSQPRATPGFDYASNEVLFSEQDFQAQYQPIGLSGLATQDAVDLARGLNDPYAEATFQTLNQVLLAEDKLLIGGQSFPLPLPAVPTVTPSTTGGTIAAGTTNMIAVAPRTGSNYYWGGNGRARASVAFTTTGSTSSATASIPAVKGAVAYDWFTSTNGGTNWFYYTTTTVASVSITAPLGVAYSLPSPVQLPKLSTTVPTINTAADNGSGQAGEIDGFLATLTADYTSTGQWATPGSATANGAVFIDGGGAALTLSGGSVTQIEQAFAQLWGTVECSPTAVMMNGLHAQEIANLVLGGSSATTFLTTDENNRISTTAGGRVGQIVNTPAGGVTVPIEVHTSLPPGTIAFRTDHVPFPQAEVTSSLEVRTLRDMSQFEYAASRVAGVAGGGPRKEFEIRSVEAFVNRVPAAMAVLSNVA